MRLDQYLRLIVVFHKRGCGACEEFLPRAERIAKAHPGIGTVVLETTHQAADALQVYYTPTTFLLHNGTPVRRIEGSADDADVEALYRAAEAA